VQNKEAKQNFSMYIRVVFPRQQTVARPVLLNDPSPTPMSSV
jgi:hypothetical protein